MFNILAALAILVCDETNLNNPVNLYFFHTKNKKLSQCEKISILYFYFMRETEYFSQFCIFFREKSQQWISIWEIVKCLNVSYKSQK